MTSQSSRHALVGWALMALGVVGTAGAGSPGEHAPTGLLVFAAASLSDALEEVDRAFTARTGVRVSASYAASSVLAKQIEAGAPADAFFSADLAWVDYLEERGLLKRGSRRDVLGNTLVLIAPADSPLRLDITPGFDLAAALGDGRLATADPDSVPAGVYARAALTKLGVWQRVSGRLVRGENVRAALAYVARGEAPLGIVYQTDAQAEIRVRVVGVFPEDTHPPIRYPVALTVRARPEAARLAEFLSGETARQIFTRYGFAPLPLAPPDLHRPGTATLTEPPQRGNGEQYLGAGRNISIKAVRQQRRRSSASLELPHAVPLHRILRNAGTPKAALSEEGVVHRRTIHNAFPDREFRP